MSNALAIAAVTATLSNLLHNVNQGTGLNGVTITTKPPDKAREGNGNQLNLFLYQVLPNAAWRNMDIPQRVRSGETGIPPLALNLYYMLTAYGLGNDDQDAHRLLGHAMSILYDHPLLGAQELQAALPGNLNSELQNQIERVRITFQPLSVEEIFRLWTGFQTQYRVSVSYEVAVVLIESTRAVKTPLPVVARGPGDIGPSAQGNPIPPFPTIEQVVTPHPPSALIRNDPGDPTSNDLTLKGHDLLPGPDAQKPPNQQIDNTKTQLSFMNPRWLKPVNLGPKPGARRTDSEITVTLPNAPQDWPAGFYTVAIVFRNSNGDEVRRSNEVSFSLAPSITLATPMVIKNPQGNITDVMITLKCSPAVQQTVQRIENGTEQTVIQEQRVSLLFGDKETPFVFPTPPNPLHTPVTLTNLFFDIGAIPAGTYFARLRVDGVDSLLVDRRVTPPQFDQSQKVVIT